jgi:hypothetical protein
MSVGDKERFYSVTKAWRKGTFAHKSASPSKGFEELYI